MSISIYWLIGGAVLIALEAFGVPGIGFLFAGLAALVTAMAVQADLLEADAYATQLAMFFVTTGVLAALLWSRLKRWRLNPNAPRFQNMIGEEAVVTGAPLTAQALGTVHWSGTLMQARLAQGTVAELPVGSRATIVAVDRTILIVAPKA